MAVSCGPAKHKIVAVPVQQVALSTHPDDHGSTPIYGAVCSQCGLTLEEIREEKEDPIIVGIVHRLDDYRGSPLCGEMTVLDKNVTCPECLERLK